MDKDSYLIFEAMYGEAISLSTDPNAEFRSQSGSMGGTESQTSLKPKVEDDGMGGYKQSLKDAGSFAIEAAKFLDPSGILSWGDVKEAYNQFIKTGSAFDGTMLVLSVGSVIPIGGKFVKPIQVAAKSTNKIDQIGGLIKSLFKKFDDILFPQGSSVKTAGFDSNNAQLVGQPTGRKYNLDHLQTQPTYTQGSFDSNNAQLVGQPTGKYRQSQGTNQFQQQLAQNGIRTDVLQSAFERAIASADETQKQIARSIREKFPNQQIPDMSKFSKTINTRWNMGDEYKTFSDYSRVMDKFYNDLDNITKNMVFDPNKIRVLDYNFYGSSNAPRQFMEVELENGSKFLMYSSSLGTSGKTSGRWYPVGGFANVPDPSNGGQRINGYVMKTQEGVDLVDKGYNKFLSDFSNYLEHYGAASLTGDYKY